MNIIDYLSWRGDLSFSASPFNEIDNLIICQMAYSEIDPYFKDKDVYAIKELADLFFKDHTYEEIKKSKSFVGQAPFVLEAMGKSVRFKDAKVHDFVSLIDDKTTEQFCCFMVDLGDKTTYVAFRGTDDTLVGWHEDFCLSYKIIPAQKAAKKYLLEHLKNKRKYRIGGHSKGGSLAVYGALSVFKKYKNILKIYSNDGPGLNKKVLSQEEINAYEILKNKILKIVPEFDIFGVLFSSNKNTIVIKSDAFTIMQHDALSWQVEGINFVKGELSEESKMIKKAFKDFLASVGEKECEEFCDELFLALDKADIKNMSDFATGGIPVLVKTISRLNDMNKADKKFGTKLIASLMKGYSLGVGQKTKNVKDNIVNTVVNKEKELLDLLK